MAEVFISYKRDQRERVKAIEDLLRNEGISVWFDANLEVGSDQGFDAEIEREVTSAYCVLACWTPAAVQSVYVRAEAKKGLDRDVLVPLVLQQCTLPVPFNAVDAVDLTSWQANKDDAAWLRTLAKIRQKVEAGRRNVEAQKEFSRAAYERVDEKIYPGTLALLSLRIAALYERDAAEYQHDIEALLEWMQSISEKELRISRYGLELADRQPGGEAWRFWGYGAAATRAQEVSKIRTWLKHPETTLAELEDVLSQPAP